MIRQRFIAAAVVACLLTGVWYSSRDPAPPATAKEFPETTWPEAAALIITATARPSLTASPTLIVLTFQPLPTTEIVLSPTSPLLVTIALPTIAPSPITNNQLPVAGPPTSEPVPTQPPAPTIPPPPPPADPSTAGAEQNAIDLVNYQRSLYGLPPYSRNETLMQIAQGHSADMAGRGYFGHDDPATGVNLGRSQMLQAGFGRAGENIFRSGGDLASAALQAVGWFMTDAVHRDNILHPAYTSIGAGIAADGPFWIITLCFAG